MPVETFPNVTSLEDLAATAHEEVDVPDAAPPTDLSEQGVEEKEGPPAGSSVPDVSGKPAVNTKPAADERPLAGDKPAPAVKPATTKPQQPAKPQTKPGTPSK
jgi:hypothetical protein